MLGARLLLLSCSDRKRPGATGDALAVYDGPVYRMLRKRWNAMPPEVTTRIVSAKYGLLEPASKIATYDKRLDPKKDGVLLAEVSQRLSELHGARRFTHAFLAVGRDYAVAVPSVLHQIHVTQASGPPGTRVRQMMDWLWGAVCS